MAKRTRRTKSAGPFAPMRRSVLFAATVAVALAAGALAGAWWMARARASEPHVAVVAGAGVEVQVNGAPAVPGTRVGNGARITAAKGDALVLLKGNRTALLRDGASILVGPEGGAVTVERGRVRFEVTRTREVPNPFHVDAGKAHVDVLGTIFVVERTWSDERVLVAVQEGRVRAYGDAGEVFLDPGEEATVVAGRVTKPRPVAVSSLREDRSEPGVLRKLKERAGKLVDDWTN